MNENLSDLRVQLGSYVEIELLTRSGEREALAFDLVPDEQADYPTGFLGINSPLAKAILGEKAGITIPYFTDELQGVKIVSMSPSTRKPSANMAGKREAAVQNAKNQIEFTNAVLFAASVDTKWGEYDADGLDYEEWKARRSQGSEEG